MKVVFVGGDTGGSVSPLIAVKSKIAEIKPGVEFHFIGTKTGIEKEMAAAAGMKYHHIPSGKLRRYFSPRNFLDIILVIAGFLKSFYLLKKIKPRILLSAGSYLAVPAAYAAKILGIKIISHQQDFVPGLANKLIFPISDKMTVSLSKSVKDFLTGFYMSRSAGKKNKIVYTGNPVREEIAKGNAKTARKIFGLNDSLSVLLIMGGGTGALNLNKIISASCPELCKYFQIIHLTGKTKSDADFTHPNYHAFEFLKSELPHALKIADIVVSRAGFSSISELSACKKTVFLVPLPDSHQFYNAKFCFEAKAAAGLIEELLTPERLVSILRKIQFDYEGQKILKMNIAKINPPDAAEKIARLAISLIS